MAPSLRSGQAIGNYVVSRRLGAGAMGEVYLAEHPQIGRRVAIKVLGAHLVHVAGFSQRFMAEARALSRIRHANVMDVYDFGQMDDGRFYYTMDYLEGRELAAVMKERGCLRPTEVDSYLQQICAGLQAAHVAGVIHRDLKPENIFVLPETPPVLKILDFGIAKLIDQSASSHATATGVLMGSPATMSPEQAMGRAEQIGVASDIYSLGVIVYWMLAGRPPFMHEVPAVVVSKHITDPPPPLRDVAPGVAVELARIVDGCLAKEPQRRPPSAEAVAETFARAVQRAEPRRRRAVRRLTDELKQLFTGSKASASDPAPAASAPVASPAEASSQADGAALPANNTTLGGATGEVLSISPLLEHHEDRIPRKRLPPWAIVGAIGCLIGLALWQVAGVPVAGSGGGSPRGLAKGTKALSGTEDPTGLSAGQQPLAAPSGSVGQSPARAESISGPSGQRPDHLPTGPAARAPGSGAETLSSPTVSELDPYHRYYLRAMEAFTGGDQRRAIQLARRAHRAAPREPSAAKLLGILYRAQGDRRSSAIYYERYLQLRPRAPDAASVRKTLKKVRGRR